MDSLTVGLVAICRVKFADETRDAVASLYPTAEEARPLAPLWPPLRQANFRLPKLEPLG